MICLKISIFVVSNTTKPELFKKFYVVICLKISIFVVSNTTPPPVGRWIGELWFAWKFLSLWYQTQLARNRKVSRYRCDLLENFYLCGIKHNVIYLLSYKIIVVICLKISIFVVSNTTYLVLPLHWLWLWFAWKFLSLWYQTQHNMREMLIWIGCDLLENFYLCGIKHNRFDLSLIRFSVVICLKISIFVVSNTTPMFFIETSPSLWFAWKFLSLWYQTQLNSKILFIFSVVICLKISIFVVSNTTTRWNRTYRDWLWFAWKFLSLWYQTQHTTVRRYTIFRCDLLENFYLCGIKHNCKKTCRLQR